ncbi:MAG: hypothetical protein IPM97_02415 [Bdellovibrionaceae bacterium]|nr:hypothetical protein [Pseudobdellovibrionaceae bacterium]
MKKIAVTVLVVLFQFKSFADANYDFGNVNNNCRSKVGSVHEEISKSYNVYAQYHEDYYEQYITMGAYTHYQLQKVNDKPTRFISKGTFTVIKKDVRLQKKLSETPVEILTTIELIFGGNCKIVNSEVVEGEPTMLH